MTRSVSIRALVLASLLTSLPPSAIGADPSPPPFPFPAPDPGATLSELFPSFVGRTPGRAVLGPRAAGRPATPNAAGAGDGAGGWLTVAEASYPDGSLRLVAQKLDGAGTRQWLPNGTPVATSPGSQTDPAIVPDGAGGLIVAWRDDRATAPGLYAQRVSAAGARLWGDEGVAIELAIASPGAPRIAGDGAGGAIVAWHDARLGQFDVYAQRVDAGGTPTWTLDGLRVYSNAFDQRDPVIAADGEGGAILVWEDQRSGLADLYGQRLSPTGARRWGAAGLAVCPAAGDQQLPSVAASDTFFVVGWRDTRAGSGSQVYAQRLDRFGVSSWAADGVPVCDLGGVRTEPAVAGDGAGGAVFAWAEQRFAASFVDVYAQRVDAGGTATWTAGGAEVFADVTYRPPSLGPMAVPAIAADGAGGVYVAYQRWDLTDNLFDVELACQRLDAAGAPVFTVPGADLSTAPLDQGSPILLPDGAGGAFALWLDLRSTELETYAQRIAADGAAQWTADGVPVYLAPGVQVNPKVVPDGSGGTIVLYLQKVGENWDVFARRFDAIGTPLWPVVPVCTAPGLQGDIVAMADGAGGAFVLWFDMRSGRSQQYVQHLGPGGAPSWTADGVLVKDSPDYVEGGTLVSDGAGGVIIPFRQLQQRGAGIFNLWAQRVSASGALLWGPEGAPLSLTAGDIPWSPFGIPDGSGGAMLVWETWPLNGSYLLAQRLDANGQAQWTTNGTLVANKHQRYDVVPRFALPVIVPDGGGGLIVAWEDARAGVPNAPDVYAQRLDASGVAAWTAGGVAVSTGAGAQYRPRLLADGAGGAIVAWADDRLGTGADLQAQRLGANGVAQWLGGPRALAAEPGVQEGTVIAADGAGGLVAAWEDGRAGGGVPDVYAQRMDGDGNLLWPGGGVAVCLAPHPQFQLAIAPDGGAGAFVAWADARDGDALLVRLQHLDATGDTTMTPDGITGVQASLVRAEPGADGVSLAWRVAEPGARFEVERRIGELPWTVIGSAVADRLQLVAFVDREVAERGPRGYRLAWDDPSGRGTAGETWLELPAERAAALAIALPAPHPARGALALEFTLPRAGDAELELLDVRGRRVASRRFESLAPGTHRWAVDPGGRLAAGVYFARLAQGGGSVVRRFCLLR